MPTWQEISGQADALVDMIADLDDPQLEAAARTLLAVANRRAIDEQMPKQPGTGSVPPGYLQNIIEQQRREAAVDVVDEDVVDADEPAEERPRLKARVDGEGRVHVEAGNEKGQQAARILGELLKAVQNQPLSPVGTAIYEVAIHVTALEIENLKLREELDVERSRGAANAAD